MDKIKRSQYVTYLDTTPSSNTNEWALLGVGITSQQVAYNPQITTEKWIIHDNATSTHDSNQKQSSVSQKMYKGDPCFEFANKSRDKINVETNILEIDTWDGTSGSYKAKKSKGLLVITNYMGEDAIIEYDLYYNGDPVEGTVTIENGTPTFTEG